MEDALVKLKSLPEYIDEREIKELHAKAMEIEFEVENKEQMLKITRDFRDKFKEIIKEFEAIPLFHEYRYNFFPGDLLKEK